MIAPPELSVAAATLPQPAVPAAPLAVAVIAPEAPTSAAAATADPAAGDVGTAPADSARGESAASEIACVETFGQRRWRLSVEACTQAFALNPKDADVALRIAHANHARSRLPEAAEWANRAIALDGTLAEAFIIVAHAEVHAGRSAAAVEAYRRYLALAPRGWHAAEARAALRAHRREAHARLRSTSDTTAAAVSVATVE